MQVADSTQTKQSKVDQLVVCDDGYAETKVITESGQKFRFPSMVRQGNHVAGAANDEIHVYTTVGSDGKPGEYTVTGKFDASAENTRFDGYPHSPENRVMIHHALRRAGLGGVSVKLATSLPVADYFDGGSIATRTLESKNNNVLLPVRSIAGAACADIRTSKVFAEGVAAWVDFMLDDKGDYRTDLSSAAAVVDIGGRTTDTVKILTGLSVDRNSSGTLNCGVLNLYDEIVQIICKNSAILKKFPLLKPTQINRNKVVEVLATGRFKGHGLDVDLATDVKLAKVSVASRILREVEGRIASGFELEHLLFVGGGAAVLRDEIREKYDTAEFVEDPEFANARGMMKLLRFT